MSASTRSAFSSLVILAVVLAAACSSGPSVDTAPAVQQEEMTVRTTPPAMREEVVSQPETETIVSEEVIEELPEDLVMLNARGYLQDIFFDTDRYDLKSDAKQSLAANSGWLQQYRSVLILVEGHCDERNTREYNIALGERRANAVRDYLILLGISSGRIKTISYGEERPFALGHDEPAWQLNRRAHFVITAR